MFGKKIYILLLLVFLTGCASPPPAWFTRYGIPDRASLTRQESIPKIMKALEDELPEVRANAAEALGTFGPSAREAGNKLFQLRTNDPSGTVRLFSHYALKEIFMGEYDGIYLNTQD